MSKTTFFISVCGSMAVLVVLFHIFFYTPAAPASDAAAWHALAKSYGGYIERDAAFLRTYADREPGYPLFAGVLYRAFGPNPFAVYSAQTLLFAVALAWFGWSLRSHLGDRAALLTVIVVGALPGVAAMNAGVLLSEPMGLSLLMFCAVLFVSARFTAARGTLIGLLLGFLALTRYIFLLLPPVFVGAVFLAGKYFAPRVPRVFLVWLLVGYAAPVLAWTVRNYVVLGVGMPTGTKGGLETIVPMKRLEGLAGKDLFAYFAGSVAGDAFARTVYAPYAERVEPYFTNIPVVEEYTRKILKSDDPASANVSALKTAGRIILAHPLRFAVMSVSEFFRKNSPMLWHNASEMQHLFAENASRSLKSAVRTAVAVSYRLLLFIPILFSMVVAAMVLTRPGIPLSYSFMAVTVWYTNIFYIFFVSSPRYGMLLYAFYGALVVLGVRDFLHRRGNALADEGIGVKE